MPFRNDYVPLPEDLGVEGYVPLGVQEQQEPDAVIMATGTVRLSISLFGMQGIGSAPGAATLSDPHSLNDGDPELTGFSAGDIICEHDGAVWGAQGTISDGTVSKAIEVEAGVDVLISGVTFSGAARDVIKIENTETTDAVNVVLVGCVAAEGATIIASQPAYVTLTIDTAVFALPYEFRNYLYVPGDPSEILTVGGDPIYI